MTAASNTPAPVTRSTPLKRAGTIANGHLGILTEVNAIRKLMLLQVVMREQKQQVVIFASSAQPVTLTLLGGETLIATEIAHRAGVVNAGEVLAQLQGMTGMNVQDPAFSFAHLKTLIDAETTRIEESPELAALDRVLADIGNDAAKTSEASAPSAQVQQQAASVQEPRQEPDRKESTDLNVSPEHLSTQDEAVTSSAAADETVADETVADETATYETAAGDEPSTEGELALDAPAGLEGESAAGESSEADLDDPFAEAPAAPASRSRRRS